MGDVYEPIHFNGSISSIAKIPLNAAQMWRDMGVGELLKGCYGIALAIDMSMASESDTQGFLDTYKYGALSLWMLDQYGNTFMHCPFIDRCQLDWERQDPRSGSAEIE